MEKRRQFRHLDEHKRDRLEILWRTGHRQKDIAEVLGVDKSTISREISRRKRKNGVYDAETAQHKARVKRLYSKYQGMKVENDPFLRRRIIEEIENFRSPDEIAGRLKKERRIPLIGKDAIYRWLYSVWGQKYCGFLCSKRRKRRKQRQKGKREMIPERTPLSIRPFWGVHGEADIFVSPRKCLTPASVAMVCEQNSRYLWGQKMPNRKPKTMVDVIREMKRDLRLNTLTLDNGIENKNHKEFGLPTYFCDPQSPWQKGLIEQSIGLLRRWFIPKGTDLRTIQEETLQGYISKLNDKYRKSLGYRSAFEAAFENDILKTKKPAGMPEKVIEKVNCISCI
jgi:IS30 family transposase